MPRLSVSLYQQVYQRWGLNHDCHDGGMMGVMFSLPFPSPLDSRLRGNDVCAREWRWKIPPFAERKGVGGCWLVASAAPPRASPALVSVLWASLVRVPLRKRRGWSPPFPSPLDSDFRRNDVCVREWRPNVSTNLLPTDMLAMLWCWYDTDR